MRDMLDVGIHWNITANASHPAPTTTGVRDAHATLTWRFLIDTAQTTRQPGARIPSHQKRGLPIRYKEIGASKNIEAAGNHGFLRTIPTIASKIAISMIGQPNSNGHDSIILSAIRTPNDSAHMPPHLLRRSLWSCLL